VDLSRRTFARVLAVSVPAGLIATFVLAGAVEAWTRARWDVRKGTPGFFLPDPVRGQRLGAGYRGWFAGVPVAINQLELRDEREYALDKSPRTFRILVLGDSVTFGHGSVGAHTYPRLLEDQLRAWRPDIDWQVWNAAVPGYNTSQELAHLLEVGPSYQPDLVIVGFFDNDLVDNRPLAHPGPVARAATTLLASLRRHVYSLELYKRVYLDLAWRLSTRTDYRRRLEHLSTEEQLISDVQQVQDLKEQELTPFERLTDAQVAAINCVYGEKANPDTIPSMQRDPGWPDWLQAVHAFQQLEREGTYRVVFFLNVVPLVCQDGDVYYDGGSSALNRLYLKVMSDGTAAVSVYDEFRHLRPSQMPNSQAHAIGNSNLVKATVLFDYLHDRVLPTIKDPRLAALLTRVPTRPGSSNP
jgi:hypothetical protein